MLVEYKGLFVFMLVSIILGMVVEILSYVVGSGLNDTEKLTVFECGFDAFESSRNEFDVRFYLVGLLFIIFDIESSYLYPWIVNASNLGSIGIYGMIDFIGELLVGLIYLFASGALKNIK